MLRRPRLAALLVGGALLVSTAAVSNAAPEDDLERSRSAHRLATELMSPFCPGRTLSDCPSPNAAAVREEIRAWIDAGEQPDVIRARLEARFGERVIGVPRTAWGWGLPIAALVLGLGILAYGLRRLLADAGADSGDPIDPALEAELRRELEDEDPSPAGRP